jgi:hypothetical protein
MRTARVTVLIGTRATMVARIPESELSLARATGCGIIHPRALTMRTNTSKNKVIKHNRITVFLSKKSWKQIEMRN